MPMIDFIEFLQQQSNIEDKNKLHSYIGDLVDGIYDLSAFNRVIGQVFPMCFDERGNIHAQIQSKLPSSAAFLTTKEKTTFIISAYIYWIVKAAPGLELAKTLISDKLDLLDEKIEMPGLIKNWESSILAAISTSDAKSAVQSVDFVSFLNTPEEKAKLKDQWVTNKTGDFFADIARIFNKTFFSLDSATQLLMSEALNAFRKNELQEWFGRVQDYVIKVLFIEHTASIPKFTLKPELTKLLEECGILEEMSQKNVDILEIHPPLFNACLTQIVFSIGILFEDVEEQYRVASNDNLEANVFSPMTQLSQSLNGSIKIFGDAAQEEFRKIKQIKQNIDTECIAYQEYLLKEIQANSFGDNIWYGRTLGVSLPYKISFIEETDKAKASSEVKSAIKKYNVIQGLRTTLHKENTSSFEQIQNFSDELTENKELISHNRDSKGLMFLKAVGFFISMIVSAVRNGTAAFWKPKSEVFADKLHDRIDKQLLQKPPGMRNT